MYSTNQETAQNFLTKFTKIIEEEGYATDQEFNADETGLFWIKMRNRTKLSKVEHSAPGFKTEKDREFFALTYQSIRLL